MSGLGTKGLSIPKTIKLFIGGQFARTESGRSFPVNHFGSEKVYANLCRASRKDFRNSVEVAQKALSGWSGKTAYNRSQILYRMAEMMEGKRQEFKSVLIDTLGLNPEVADKSVDDGIDAFVYYAGFADKYQQVIGAVNPVAGPHHNFTGPEPVGVVGLICSLSLDLAKVCGQIGSVICSGNTTVVLWPEEGASVLGPLSEVLATSDVPGGVVNLLSGFVSELYPHFASHMELQSICYLGNDPEILGDIKEQAADNMKRVVTLQDDQPSLEPVLQFVEYKTVWHPIGS